jgi:hypothetical protein
MSGKGIPVSNGIGDGEYKIRACPSGSYRFLDLIRVDSLIQHPTR